MIPKKELQRNRIFKMFVLANYYSAYSERKLFAKVYGVETSWESAEKMAELGSFIVGEEVSPLEIIGSKEEYEDMIFSKSEIIENLRESINSLDMDEKDIIAFCESAIHEYIPILSVNYFNFAEQMKWVALYTMGSIEELVLEDIHIVPPNIRPFRSIMFKKTWWGIENRYNEIVEKRNKRKAKL
jgi:hypothetical protein